MSDEWCDFFSMMNHMDREAFEETLKDLMQQFIYEYGLRPVEIEMEDYLFDDDETWSGEYAPPDPDDNSSIGKIVISRDQNNEESIKTAFHEIGHAIQDEYFGGVNELEHEGMEEDAENYASELMEDLYVECEDEFIIESVHGDTTIIINVNSL